jgi:asparagine synthase (glutamine-hydrolysing)
MCGIAGFIYKDKERPAPVPGVMAMCDAIAHRGPDAAAYYSRGPLALGHRRLSILDLSEAGTQPMASHDDRFVIVFNGEIYNYLELRKELQGSGVRFRTQTDTEVVLEAYRAWGSACVSRFNGMWAFALFDRDQRNIFMSRDRFGIKPFHYLDAPDAFLFASEIKAILTMRPEERVPNWGTVAHFIPTGVFGDGPETFFANIRNLLPGHNASYDLERGTLRTWRYWSVEPERFAEHWAGRDPVEVLRELLHSSVRLHMRSDVPVGSCLSGGVDSSTLVCLMSQHVTNPVYTFSGIYRDGDCNEKEYVDAINAHVPTVPCPVFPEPHGDLLADLRTITWHQDNPTAGPGLYTQYYVMKRAGREVKVLLDGQGADEMFAGYIPYFRAHLLDLMRSGLRGKVQAIGKMAGIWRHWGAATTPRLMYAMLPRLVRRVVERAYRTLGRSQAVASVSYVHPDLESRSRAMVRERNEFAPVSGELNQLLQEQLLNTSLPALLHYEDRNSMAFSVEARVPFLDHRIVEFALSLDPKYKISSTWTKWVLRKAAEDVLPSKVTWRRSKMGYPTPMARWFRQDSEKDAVQDLLFSVAAKGRGIFCQDTLKKAWDAHQQGQDHSWLLFRAATMELWYRDFIEKWQPCPVPLTTSRRGSVPITKAA